MAEVGIQTNGRSTPPPMVDSGFAEPPRRDAFSLLEVSQAASRELHLGVDVPKLGSLAGKLLFSVNQQPEFHKAGLGGTAFRQLLLSNLTPDVAKLIDPAQADSIRKEQDAARSDQGKKSFDPFVMSAGRVVNGVWVADRGGEQTSGTSRVSSDTYGRSLTNSAVVRTLTNEGYKPSEIAGAMAFTKILGVDANRYAGYFVGASQDTRDAIADHVKKGTAVTDEKLHKSEDVAAVMGAIKAGKMKPDEAPKSVQKIMKDMKESGLDPATAAPTAIHGYFKKHPKALDEAKRAVAKSEATQKTMSDDEKLKQISSVAPGKPTKNEITKPNASPTQKTVKLGL